MLNFQYIYSIKKIVVGGGRMVKICLKIVEANHYLTRGGGGGLRMGPGQSFQQEF
jgi:hypothetical protein